MMESKWREKNYCYEYNNYSDKYDNYTLKKNSHSENNINKIIMSCNACEDAESAAERYEQRGWFVDGDHYYPPSGPRVRSDRSFLKIAVSEEQIAVATKSLGVPFALDYDFGAVSNLAHGSLAHEAVLEALANLQTVICGLADGEEWHAINGLGHMGQVLSVAQRPRTFGGEDVCFLLAGDSGCEWHTWSSLKTVYRPGSDDDPNVMKLMWRLEKLASGQRVS